MARRIKDDVIDYVVDFIESGQKGMKVKGYSYFRLKRVLLLLDDPDITVHTVSGNVLLINHAVAKENQ